jgi:hypothetical protein
MSAHLIRSPLGKMTRNRREVVGCMREEGRRWDERKKEMG